MQSRALRTMTAVSSAALLMAGAACADKQLTPAGPSLSKKILMNVTATGIQASQVSAGNLYLMVGALYAAPPVNNEDDGIRVLSISFARISAGSMSVTLPVDLAPCLADNQRLGSKEACSMYLAAAVITDTFSLKDTATKDIDPFRAAYDYAFPIGPFDAAPGRAPTIPAIDLSLSRFAVREWVADEALRLGGAVNPNNVQSMTVAGVVSGTNAPTLFTLAKGADYSTPPSATTFLQPYPQLQMFDGTQWKRFLATVAGTSANFNDLTAFSTSEVYIGSTAGLFRFDGSTFAKAGGIGDTVFSVASATGTSGKLVIAGGPSGKVWIGNGTTFTPYSLPISNSVSTTCITGPTEAFAGSVAAGLLYRFDGTTWTAVSVGGGGFRAEVQCPSPGQVFVISGGNQPLKWTASGFTAMPSLPISSGRGNLHWGVVSASEIYAYADSGSTDRAYYKFDGSSWRETGRARWSQSGGELWADPRGGAAYGLSPFGRLEKITATGGTVLAYQPPLRDAIMTSPSSAFVVGWNLFLARWNGSKWTVDAPPAKTPTVRVLHGVWSDGPTNAWAVGNSSTIFRYDGSAWNVVSDVNKPITGSIDNYWSVWGVGNDVWIGSDAGITHCRSATACTLESSGGAIFSIWGSSSSNIIAVGGGGQIRRFNGTSWSPMTSPTTRQLARVSGSGPNDVWAVGDSVVLHYDGTSWRSAPLTGLGNFFYSRSPSGLQSLFQLGLWARGPREVYMGGDPGNVVRWDGAEWHELTPGNTYRRRIVAISGGVGGCGIAITEGQTDLPAPTLWRGIGPDGCNASPMTPPSVWP